MTPYKQLYRHRPEDGIWGDCYRSAIASLLDLQPAEVPHWFDQGILSTEAYPRVDAWLAARGLCRITAAFSGELQVFLDHMKTHNAGIYYLLTGKSRTGCNHTVIGLDDAIVHDPSLNDSGIIGPCIEDGLYWLEFIGAGICTTRRGAST
jgi:hypothetical protein